MYCIARSNEAEYKIDPRGKEIEFFPWELDEEVNNHG